MVLNRDVVIAVLFLRLLTPLNHLLVLPNLAMAFGDGYKHFGAKAPTGRGCWKGK